MKQNDSDILKVSGINSKGFGIFPKIVSKDRRLTIEAKSIYAYICSYAGSGNTAFPSVSKITYDLVISEDRFYRHQKLLVVYGYISVDKVRSEEKGKKGRFEHNIYTLHTEILESKEEIKPYPQNKGTAKNEKPYPQNPGMDNPGKDNKGTNINSSKNNSLEEEEDKKKFGDEKNNDEESPENHQGENDEETQIAKYRYLAQRVEATDQDLAEALKAMDNEPNLDTPVAWLITAIKNAKSNRELAERPKNQRDPKTSTKSRSKKPKTDSGKYEKFYL